MASFTFSIQSRASNLIYRCLSNQPSNKCTIKYILTIRVTDLSSVYFSVYSTDPNQQSLSHFFNIAFFQHEHPQISVPIRICSKLWVSCMGGHWENYHPLVCEHHMDCEVAYFLNRFSPSATNLQGISYPLLVQFGRALHVLYESFLGLCGIYFTLKYNASCKPPQQNIETFCIGLFTE